MQNITKKKRGAIICAAVVIGILGIYLGIFLYPILWQDMGETIAVIILLVYSLLILAIIIGVIFALRQRLQEIEGGEEEDAKMY